MPRAARPRKSRISSSGALVIRPARPADLKACAKILHTKEVAGANNWYPTRDILQRQLGKYFLVAKKDGKILGASVVEPLRFGVIGWWFAVKKGARGKGVGSALMDATEKTAKKDGKYFFLVYSKVGTTAVRFYEKRGYMKGQNFSELVKSL